jgi:hypothetical protein
MQVEKLEYGRAFIKPIRCANQNNERKDPVEEYVLREKMKEKNPSRVSLIESISMSTFVEGAAFS